MNRRCFITSTVVIGLTSNSVVIAQSDQKVALDKFKKMVAALKQDNTITPNNKDVTESGVRFTHDTENASYDVVPSGSLVTGFKGTYTVSISIIKHFSDGTTTRYTSDNDYIFGFDRESQKWEFNSRKKVLTQLNDSLFDKAGNKDYTTVNGLKGFTPEYQKAIIKCLKAQDK